MKANNRRARLVPVALISLVSLVLLRGNHCTPGYPATRECSALSMTMSSGGPGVFIPDCVSGSGNPIRISPREDATFEMMPAGLSGASIRQGHMRAFEMTAAASIAAGTYTFVLHTFPRGICRGRGRGGNDDDNGNGDNGGRGRCVSPFALDYTVTVTLDGGGPPPPPPPPTVTVSATPNPVGTGGSTTLAATVMGGVGPFTYSWRGYRDDGEHTSSFSLSSAVAASPQATVFYPDYSYYFFVTVTDTGVMPNTTATGFVRFYETDAPIARVVISPATIKANVDGASFDGTSSTNAGGPITGWSIDYGGSIVPTSLEGDLQLSWPPSGNVCGQAVPCGSTSLTLSYGPFANPGTYRVQLTSMDTLGNTETSTEYFVVSP